MRFGLSLPNYGPHATIADLAGLAEDLGADSQTNRAPLSGDRAAIQRDLDAYQDAGLDYLVANARQGREVSELARAMEAVARALVP